MVFPINTNGGAFQLTPQRIASLIQYFERRPTKRTICWDMGLFSEVSRVTSLITIEERGRVLNMIEPNVHSSPAQQAVGGTSRLISFSTNSYKANARVTASMLEGRVIAGNGAWNFQVENDLIMEAQEELGDAHDVTREHAVISCLRGKVVSPLGVDLLDMHDTFLTTKRKKFEWEFGAEGLSLPNLLQDLIDYMDDANDGVVFNEIGVFCTPNFAKSLRSEPSFLDLYKNTPQVQNIATETRLAMPFVMPGFESIKFIPYKFSAPILDVNGDRKMVNFLPETPKGNAVIFPILPRTNRTLMVHKSPARYLSTVNKPPTGNGRFIKIIRDPNDEFLDILTEANYVPTNLRPALTGDILGA